MRQAARLGITQRRRIGPAVVARAAAEREQVPREGIRARASLRTRILGAM